MTFPELGRFLPLALLLMRLMIGAIFITSGWGHVTRTEERAKSIGMSKAFTRFLGTAELAGFQFGQSGVRGVERIRAGGNASRWPRRHALNT